MAQLPCGNSKSHSGVCGLASKTNSLQVIDDFAERRGRGPPVTGDDVTNAGTEEQSIEGGADCSGKGSPSRVSMKFSRTYAQSIKIQLRISRITIC